MDSASARPLTPEELIAKDSEYITRIQDAVSRGDMHAMMAAQAAHFGYHNVLVDHDEQRRASLLALRKNYICVLTQK